MSPAYWPIQPGETSWLRKLNFAKDIAYRGQLANSFYKWGSAYNLTLDDFIRDQETTTVVKWGEMPSGKSRPLEWARNKQMLPSSEKSIQAFRDKFAENPTSPHAKLTWREIREREILRAETYYSNVDRQMPKLPRPPIVDPMNSYTQDYLFGSQPISNTKATIKSLKNKAQWDATWRKTRVKQVLAGKERDVYGFFNKGAPIGSKGIIQGASGSRWTKTQLRIATEMGSDLSKGSFKSIAEAKLDPKYAKHFTKSKILGMLGTAALTYQIATDIFGEAEAFDLAGKTTPYSEYELTNDPNRSSPLATYKMYNPEDPMSGKLRNAVTTASYFGGMTGIAASGLGFTAADMLIAGSRGAGAGVVGEIGREGIVNTATSMTGMLIAGKVFETIGGAWNAGRAMSAQRKVGEALAKKSESFWANQSTKTARDIAAGGSGPAWEAGLHRGTGPAVLTTLGKNVNPLVTKVFNSASWKFAKGAYIIGPTVSRIFSSGMLDPLMHGKRNYAAWTNPEANPYRSFLGQELSKIGTPAILKKGFELRADALEASGQPRWKTFIPNLQDIDPLEFTTDPVFQATLAPAALSSYYAHALPYYNKEIYKRYISGERAEKVSPLEAVGHMTSSGIQTFATTSLFMLPQSLVEIYGMPRWASKLKIPKIAGVGLMRGSLSAGRHYWESQSWKSPFHLLRGDMTTRPAAMPMASAILAGTAASFTAGLMGLSPGNANKVGYAAEAGILASNYTQMLRPRGTNNITETKSAKMIMSTMSPEQATIYKYGLSMFAGRTIGSLTSKERAKISYQLSSREEGTVYNLPMGIDVNLSTNWSGVNLPYKEGASWKSYPSSFTLSQISDRTIGSQLPSEIVTDIATDAIGLSTSYYWAKNAAQESDPRKRSRYMKEAVSEGGSPFGRSAEEFVSSHRTMYENQMSVQQNKTPAIPGFILDYPIDEAAKQWGEVYKFRRENVSRKVYDGMETLYNVTDSNSYWGSKIANRKHTAGGTEPWQFAKTLKPEERKFWGKILKDPKDISDVVKHKMPGATLTSSMVMTESEEEGKAYDVTQLMMLELEEPSKSGGYSKAYKLDPISIDMGGDNSMPFSDELVLAAMTDSIQEWNLRSPKRGGGVFAGEYD